MTKSVFPGHELRQRREELGLSVYEAFRHTRVPTQFIEALERGDLQAMPASCYAIGYLKSYCAVLELDAERFIDTFRTCNRPSAPTRFLHRKKDLNLSASSWLNEVLAWAIVMGIVLLGWVAYTVVFSPRSDVNDRAVEAGTVDVAPPVVPSEKY